MASGAALSVKEPRHPAAGYARGRETRQRILEAAVEVFAEAGFDLASTRAIADRAGVNLGSLTYYFGNKEGLYRACAEHIVESIEATAKPVWDPLEQALENDKLSRAELMALLGGLFDAMGDWAGNQHIRRTWRLFSVRERARPESAMRMVDDRMVRRSVHVLALLVGRIVERPANAPDVVTRAVSMIGHFQNFDRMREMMLNELGWADLSQGRGEIVRSAIWDQIVAGLATDGNVQPGN